MAQNREKKNAISKKWVTACVLALSIAGVRGQGQNMIVERVWRSGDPLPGTGATMSTVQYVPQIDNAGNVLFVAGYHSQSSFPSGGQALFYGGPGNLHAVQYRGQRAPGFGPNRYIWDWDYVLSENGTIMTLALVASQPNFSGFGLYVGTPGNMTLVTGVGLPAAGGLPSTASGIDDGRLRCNSSGRMAFAQSVSNPPGPNYGTITAGPIGGLQTVIQSGGPVPGVSGASFLSTGTGLGYNDLGWAGLAAFFEGAGINATNNVALFSGGPGDLRILARTGSQAPDMPRGTTFLNFSNVPAQNAQGNVAFFGLIQGPGVTASNNIAYWFGPREAPHVVMRTAGPAPALPGYTLQQFNWATFISEDNRTLLSGRLAGPGLTSANDDAVWWGTPGSLQLLLREGDQAPGFAVGVVISFEDPDHVSPSFARNDVGALLMLGRLVGEGVTPADDYAWWFRGPGAAQWQLVVRTGQLFDGRTIAGGLNALSLRLSAGTEGFGQSINDAGVFAMEMHFNDGSTGVYRFTVP